MTQSITRGTHHIGLTVPNIDQTGAFFRNILGYDHVGEIPDYPATFLSDGTTMVTLWQATDPATTVAFDRHNVIGLHHLALIVDSNGALDSLSEVLAARADIDVEFAPEPLLGGPTRHMMCTIPGGIRVEFIAPAS